MRDIAVAAGVSQSTVSRVLNDAPTRVPIAPQTRERVTAAARELGYRPNPLARALRGAPTMLLGAVVRDFSDPFFADAIEALVREVPNTLGGAEDAVRALIELPEPPTAIVATTDLVAVGVLHAAYSLGRTVPDQLSVVGFDDILIAAHTVPALTTLRMPTTEIVREGVNTAIDLARDGSAPRDPRIRVFEPTLVVRQSTSPPPS